MNREAQAKIIDILKNKVMTQNLDDFLYSEKTDYSWQEQRHIMSSLGKENINWGVDKRIEVFNKLSEIILDTARHTWTHHLCKEGLLYLFDYMPKHKYPFLIESGCREINERIKIMMEEDEGQWSSK